ncbi:MAG: hypothetical protein ACXVAX_00045 [Pseudobdellovibrio sp.]
MTVNLKKLALYVLSSTLFYSQMASAAGASSSGGGVKPSIGAMVLFGPGKMGNDSDVLSRNMIYTPVDIFAGFNIKKLRLGINYEYLIVGQSDDPASYSNQNIGGKGSSAGLRFDYYNGSTSFGIIYHLSDKYTLDKPTLSGATSEYDIKSGLGVQFYTQIKKRIGLVVDYSMGEYKSTAANSNDIKWDRTAIGLVFTNFANSGGK